MLMRGARATLAAILGRKLLSEFGSLNMAERNLMLKVSVEDFLNYIKVDRGFIHEYSPNERAEFYIEVLSDRAPLTLMRVIDDWFDVWAFKWRQRVRLVMDEEEDSSINVRVREKTDPLVRELRVVREARRFALGSLIRSGEVCFTNLLAESVVRGVLYYMLQRASSSREVREALERNPTLLLDEIIRRVKSMSKYKGPLVTLRVEAAMFSEEGFMPLGFW